MGLVSAPYLDQRAVTREIARGEALARELLAERYAPHQQTQQAGVEVPNLLLDPRAHRARACLLYLAENPGASNRQVADAVGVTGRTQISALLARMHSVGLLAKRPSRPGGPNAWSLSQHGERISNMLAED
jgi:hypothetical protein